MIFRFLPFLLGAYFAYAGGASLTLAILGRRVDATVDETVIKAAKQIPGSGEAPPSYVLRAKVAYHFDACPGRLQPAAACPRFEGSDTLIMRSPYEVLAQDTGYPVPVVFLAFAPQVNALCQPRHLLVYGLLEFLLGVGIVLFESRAFVRERRARGTVSLKAAAVASPEDPWGRLGQNLGADDRPGPRPPPP